MNKVVLSSWSIEFSVETHIDQMISETEMLGNVEEHIIAVIDPDNFIMVAIVRKMYAAIKCTSKESGWRMRFMVASSFLIAPKQDSNILIQ